MAWHISGLGFVVGLLVGLTGIGGAALMTPLLILIGGVRPVMAVGSDLAYGAITKAVGSVLHLRQQTVDLPVARQLAIGSLPMALVGVALIRWMQGGAGHATVDQFVSRALGIVLILVAVIVLLRSSRRRLPGPLGLPPLSGRRTGLTILLGAGVGLLVGVTSIGSGSLIAAALLTVYPEMPLRRVVGTDIFHAAFLTLAAGLAHFGLGTVDVSLVGRLLIGSIPGVWLGTRFATSVPDRVLRPILATTLIGIGYKLL